MPWNIVGHRWAVDLLKHALARDRLRHAYLLTGPPGIGKRTLALTLAQALNCQGAGDAPCGACRACRLIGKGGHPDVVTVEGEEGTLKVDQIRELQKQLALTPNEGRYHIAIILRFHEATASAANALLKTLEEPPPRAKLLLTAASAGVLLPTIVSRCEGLALRPLPISQVRSTLEESQRVSPDRADLLARLSGGRLGWAVTHAQDESKLKWRSTILAELGQLLKASRVSRFAYADTLARNKAAAPEVLAHWLSYWRDVLLAASEADVPLTNVDLETQIHSLAARLDVSRARQAVQAIRQAAGRLDRNVNIRLALEVLLLDLPHL